jgi:hypothetical protein
MPANRYSLLSPLPVCRAVMEVHFVMLFLPFHEEFFATYQYECLRTHERFKKD